MRPSLDPAELSPQQCRSELAGILTRGVLRLRKRRLLAGEVAVPPPSTAQEFSAGGLEVSAETVLSVPKG